jgi:DNA-binding CsgD family transcriptional regulator
MGADLPMTLEPRCPAENDPGIQGYLRLAKALTGAAWVELELRPNSAAPIRTYRVGNGTGNAVAVALEARIDYEASLRLGRAAQPTIEQVGLLSESLARALGNRSLRIQATILRGALDASADSVLIFDSEGRILFANPPADQLLSLQTEDRLLAGCDGHSRQPLFALLCALIESVTSADGGGPTWRGAIELDDGRMMACEVTRVTGPDHEEPNSVLVVLQSTEIESNVRIQAFASSHALSPREREVLHLLGRGLTTAAMAEELGISPHTVRDHLKHLYSKTGTKGRSELLGLISRTSKIGLES